MASNDLVFTVQVEDIDGNVIARSQNNTLSIGEGIRLTEYREKLSITVAGEELLDEANGDKTVHVGEVLYQLTPHVLTKEKERLVFEYRLMIVGLLAVGLVVVLLAMRILWNSASSITASLRKIAYGQSGVSVDADSFITEFRVITKGVNSLSKNLDTARDGRILRWLNWKRRSTGPCGRIARRGRSMKWPHGKSPIR